MVKKSSDDVLPITAARSRLFDLIEEILTGRRSRVELSHRSFDEHVVMVRKADLDAMDADLAALRARLGAEPRVLRGFATLHEDADVFLARTRAHQADLARQKLAALLNADADAGEG
jgi:hypothetical protein